MKFFFLFVLSLSGYLIEAQSINWPADITDATEQQCNDGEIDLHPPGLGTYTYEWTNSSGQLLGTTEDIQGLAPGNYTVSVTGVNCSSVDMTYHVGIRGYDFRITRVNPSNCTSSKTDRDNGFLRIQWNQSQRPVPLVEYHDPQQGWTDISSSPIVTDLGAGEYRFRITVGSCDWIITEALCCCSTEYEPLPGDRTVCPHLTDGLDFEVSLIREVAASDRNSSDGSLTLRVESPAYSGTIEWTGPNGYTGSGQFIDGLAPGNYCYTYHDDCGQQSSDCFEVRSCDDMELSIIVEDKQNECGGEGNGWIQFALTGEGNPQVYFRDELGMPTDLIVDGLLDNLSGGTYQVILYNDYRCEILLDVEIINVELELRINRKECREEFYCEGELYKVVQHPTYFEKDPRYCWLSYEICSLTGDIINVIDQSGATTTSVTTEGRTRCTANITCPEGFTSLGGVLRTTNDQRCTGGGGASCVTTTVCFVGEINSSFLVSSTTSAPTSRTRSGTCGPYYETIQTDLGPVRRAYYNWRYRYSCGDGGGSFLCCSNERANIALTGDDGGNSLKSEEGIFEDTSMLDIDPPSAYIQSVSELLISNPTTEYVGLLLNVDNVEVEQSKTSLTITSTPLSTFKLYPRSYFNLESPEDESLQNRDNNFIDEGQIGDNNSLPHSGAFSLLNTIGQIVLQGKSTPEIFRRDRTSFKTSEIADLGVVIPSGLYFLKFDNDSEPKTLYIAE